MCHTISDSKFLQKILDFSKSGKIMFPKQLIGRSYYLHVDMV